MKTRVWDFLMHLNENILSVQPLTQNAYLIPWILTKKHFQKRVCHLARHRVRITLANCVFLPSHRYILQYITLVLIGCMIFCTAVCTYKKISLQQTYAINFILRMALMDELAVNFYIHFRTYICSVCVGVFEFVKMKDMYEHDNSITVIINCLFMMVRIENFPSKIVDMLN